MALNTSIGAHLQASTLISENIQVNGAGPDGISSLTKINGLPISAALEIQSTQGGLVVPRLTQAEVDALSTSTTTSLSPGTMVFNTDSGEFEFNKGGALASQPFSGVLMNEFSITLTAAQILAMTNANTIPILPAIANKKIIIHRCIVEKIQDVTFGNGSEIRLKYGATNTYASAAINATVLSQDGNRITVVTGVLSTIVDPVNVISQPVVLSLIPAGPQFTAGGNSTVKLDIMYSVV